MFIGKSEKAVEHWSDRPSNQCRVGVGQEVKYEYPSATYQSQCEHALGRRLQPSVELNQVDEKMKI